MRLSRREALALAGAATVAGCAPVAARVRERAPRAAFRLPDGPVERAERFWNRAAFGPRPGDLAAYKHDETVARLLAAKEPESLVLQAQIARLDAFQVNAMELRDMPEDAVLAQLMQAAVLHAVYGANPLMERMADFWTNHFSVYGKKGLSAYRKGSDEVRVVRENAMGSFPKMLVASATSPAMLAYLDGIANVKGHPNENYARELMELHTLGVDGGYTQRDIQEVARCFTGWSLERRFMRPRGTFRFIEERHDDGEKTVLGHRIPAGGGVRDGYRVLDIVAKHPSTGRFLGRKLCRYFLGHEEERFVQSVADAYTRTDGDIRAFVEPVLTEEAMESSKPILKRPLDLVASTLRALDATTDGGRPIQAHLTAMGQPLYQWPMPDGFPVDANAWATSMLPRWNFAFALERGEIGGTNVEIKEPKTIHDALLPKREHAPDPEHPLAMAICHPEFQWR